MSSMCKEVEDCCNKTCRFPEDFTREVLCCQICYGQFVRPRQLPCLHTFCEDCLARHLQVYQMQSTSIAGQLPCPTCREMIEVPAKGITGFRHDFKVTKFADILKELDTDHGWTKACQVCKLSDHTIAADVFCNICNKYFCNPCLAVHDKVKLFVQHEIVNLNERDKSKIICKEHADQIEMIKYYCDICEVGICTICTMTKHENHRVIDVGEGLTKQQDKMKRLLAEIKCQITDIDNTLDAITNDQGSVNNTFDKLRNDIRTHAARRIADIQEEERKLLLELDDREKNHTENLDGDQDALTAYKEKLMKYAEQAKYILAAEDSVSTMSTRMAHLDELTSTVGATISEPKPVDAMTKHVLRFTPGMMILGSLEECIGPRHELSSKFWRAVGRGGSEFLTEDEYKALEKSYTSLPSHLHDKTSPNSLSITTILPARGSPLMYRSPSSLF
ncbi:E3 ubiquitin-protein ligase TRIM45-like [Tubulanus polymorphus]|uniref:E3 ubiquitin-protein ligase TRIM45-like n=1 Tax=Tubulanus polymorphus TaxID=672921 RepID=UPI003DA2211E